MSHSNPTIKTLLSDRLSSGNTEINLQLTTGQWQRGILLELGEDFIKMRLHKGGDVVISLAAIAKWY